MVDNESPLHSLRTRVATTTAAAREALGRVLLVATLTLGGTAALAGGAANDLDEDGFDGGAPTSATDTFGSDERDGATDGGATQGAGEGAVQGSRPVAVGEGSANTARAETIDDDVAVEVGSSADGLDVRIAVPADRAPFYFVGESGELQGTLIDFWRFWAERTGSNISFVRFAAPADAVPVDGEAATSPAIDAILTGDADIHVGLFEPAPRVTGLTLSLPLQTIMAGVFHHRDIGDIRVPEELSAYRIGVVEGSYAADWLAKNLSGLDLRPFDSRESLLDAAVDGVIRVFIDDATSAQFALRARGAGAEFTRSASGLASRDIRAALPTDDPVLLGQVNDGLSRISRSERTAIVRAWTAQARGTVPGKLTVALVANQQPYSFATPAGQASGLLVDAWQLWSQQVDRPLSFVVKPTWEASVDAVARGEADLHAGVLLEEARAERLLASAPFIEIGAVLVYRTEGGAAAPSLDSTQTPSVGVLAGSRQARFLAREYPHLRVTDFNSWESMLRYLAWGSVDVVVAERAAALAAIGEQGLGATLDTVRLQAPLAGGPLAAGIRTSEPELQALVDTGFAGLSRQVLANLERRWLTAAAARTGDTRAALLSNESREWLRSHPVLRVGLARPEPPFLQVTDAGGNAGIDPEIAAALTERLGVEMTLVTDAAASDAYDALDRGELDLVLGAVPTATREQTLSFSRPYANDAVAIFVPADSDTVAGIAYLSGERVAVLGEGALDRQARSDYPQVRWQRADSLADGFAMVTSGRAAAFLTGGAAGAAYLAGNPQLQVVRGPTTAYEAPAHIASRSAEAALGDAVARGLDVIWSRERAEVISRYLGDAVSAPQAPAAAKLDWRVLAGFAAAALVLAIAMGILLGYRRGKSRRSDRRDGWVSSSDDELLSLVDNAAVGLATLGPRQQVERINPAFAAMTGFSQDELRGRRLPELLDADPNTRLASTTELPSGDQRMTFERHYRDKQGVAHWVEVSMTWVRGSAGKRRAVATVTNIDARKRAEAETSRLAEEASSAEAAAATRTSGTDSNATLAAELRVPMHGLVGMLDEVARGEAGNPAAARTARDTAAALAGIFEDTDATDDSLATGVEVLDAETLVDGVLDTLAPGAARLGVALSTSVDERLPMAVLGDATRLRQVALHLASHAVEMASDGRVDQLINLEHDLESVHFAIEWSPADGGASGQLGLSALYPASGLGPAETAALNDGAEAAAAATDAGGAGLVRCRRLLERMDGNFDVDEQQVKGHLLIRATVPVTMVEQRTYTDSLQRRDERPLRLLLAARDPARAECVRHAMGFWGNRIDTVETLDAMYDRLQAVGTGSGEPYDALLMVSDAEWDVETCQHVHRHAPEGRAAGARGLVVLATSSRTEAPAAGRTDHAIVLRLEPLRRRELIDAVAILAGVVGAGEREAPAGRAPVAAGGVRRAGDDSVARHVDRDSSALAADAIAASEALPDPATLAHVDTLETSATVSAFSRDIAADDVLPGEVVGGAPAAFDPDSLLAAFEDDHELVCDLLDEFMTASHERLLDMNRHLRRNELPGLAAAAGELRAGALGIGAHALAAVCRNMQEAGDTRELDAVNAVAPSLVTEMRRARDAVQAFKAAHPRSELAVA